MAMSEEQIQAILNKQMPGHRLVPQAANPAADAVASHEEASADAVSPSLDQLQQRFLGMVVLDSGQDPYQEFDAGFASKTGGSKPAKGNVAKDSEQTMRLVEPNDQPVDSRKGTGPKAVVFGPKGVEAVQG